MSHKIKVQFGGAADATVHDYSVDVRLFNKDGTPAIHGGMRFDDGGGSVGEFVLIDDDNKIPAGDAAPNDLHLAGHNPIWWIEDSPGYDAWLSVGWIDVKDAGRFGHPYADSRTWQGSWADANKELDGITLLTDQARTAESDVDRIQWVIDTFYSGDPRPSTDLSTDSDYIPNTNTVTMPAKTYKAGTAVHDIIKDCAGTAGKVYGIIIHDASSASHKCFQYIDEEDHTTNLSAAKISDKQADWDPTDDTAPVFEPHWLQGAAVTEDPGELISGVVSTWKGGTVTVTDSDHADDYNYYVVPINDDVSETEAQATAYATAYLHSRWNEHITHQPSIMVSPSQHPLIRAGMSIQLKSAASMGGQYLGTYQTRRIAEVNWEPGGWWNGEPFLWAHLQLDRPLRILSRAGRPAPGPQPAACDANPSVLRSWKPASLDTQDTMTVEGNANTALLAFFIHNAGATDPTATYTPDTEDVGAPTYSFTKYGELVNTGGTTTDLQITVLTLANPAASNGAQGGVNIFGAGDHYSWGILLLQDIDPDSLIRATDSFLGTVDSATSCTNTITSQANELILSIVGYTTQQAAASAAAPGSDQTLIMAWDGSGVSPGQDQFIGGMSRQTATSTSTVDSWTQSGGLGGALTQWDLAITACPSVISIGGPGEGTTGDGTDYVPGGTIIEHGDLSGKGGIMHDDTQIEVDPTGLTNTDGVTVHEVIEDFDAAISSGGAPTTVDYLVGTASAGLSAEIVVGTTPGGELGGTWASPTVDTTHSGSAHHTEDHATRHASGGGDAVKLDDLAAPDDNTDLNASTSKHGLLPKLGGGTTNFLRADGTWNAPGGAGVTLSDDTPLEESGTGDAGDASTASRSDHVHPEHAGSSSGSSPFYLDTIDLDSTYGDEFDGTSLDAKWTRLNTDADIELFPADSWMRTPIHFTTVPSGGFGYYQTPASMPTYMELIWKGSKYGKDNDDMAAGPFFVTSAGAGVAAAIQASEFTVSALSSGAWSGTNASLLGSIGNPALGGGFPQWVRLIRVAGDGITYFVAQFSLDGNTWHDQIAISDSTAVTRIGFGIVRGTASAASRALATDRFNTVALTLGTNFVHTPSSGTSTFTASSSFSGFSPSAAGNGSTSSEWASNGYAAGQYWQVAWSVAQTINTIILVGRTSDTWGYGYIEFSDGSKVALPGFMYVANRENNTAVIRLSTAKSTTLLKVVSTSGGSGNPGFKEVQAFNAS